MAASSGPIALLWTLVACVSPSRTVAALPKPSAFLHTISGHSIIPNAALTKMSSEPTNKPCEAADDFSVLPGDPSLILTTNVDLGDKKLEVMKGISKAITKNTGKPESYVAVSVNDNAAVIFGGSDAPCALGCMYSLGAIAQESNGAIHADVSDLLEPFGVAADRMYINFFDIPRANCGWSRRTFAG